MSVMHHDVSAEQRRATLGQHTATARSRSIGSAAKAAATSGVGRGAWTAAEQGQRTTQLATWAKIEDVLGWPQGSAAAYLAGAGPLPEAPMTTSAVPGLPPDVAAVLATRNARTTAEQVAVLQGIVLDLVRAAGEHRT